MNTFQTLRCVLVAAIVAAPALAAAEEVSAETREQARQHSQQAQIQYNLGRFEQALEEYSRAYELLPHPAFLFNLAQCHRELGNHERAVFFFEGYLRELPDAPNRALSEELLQESVELLEQQRAEAVPLEEEGTQEPVEQPEEVATGDPLPEEAGEVTPEEEEEPHEEEARRPVYRRWWFWTIMGVVVVGAVAGETVAGLYASNPDVVPPAGSVGTVDWR